LGGSRGGRWFTYRNLMFTMLLGGLWHGASWNFLIWGGYQGTLLAIERALRGERPPADDWDWTYPFRAALTFVLALVGWVFFRAADLRQSVQVLGQMFGGSGGRALLEPWHLGLAALALVLAVGEEKWEWFERAIRAPMPVYAAALALMLFCLEIFGVLDAAIPFIYFQF
jgi:D-alanyl-lipoteichoic acid acyltransferase DltB (MBOAT superfamily)